MAQRTIPTIASLPQLAQWQAGLRQTIKQIASPPIPANVSVTSKQGGNYITWAAMTGADGYQVQISEDGDFAKLLSVVQLPSAQAIAYFDSVPTSGGAAPKKRYYRVAATSGTIANPQSTVGKPSSTVSATAISPNDTVTVPATSRDLSDYDRANAGSSNGDYRGINLE